jgi:hypothetical protein
MNFARGDCKSPRNVYFSLKRKLSILNKIYHSSAVFNYRHHQKEHFKLLNNLAISQLLSNSIFTSRQSKVHKVHNTIHPYERM